ncbi:hypothetical protein Tco_0967618 [Tanacetum coccineum]
MTQDNPSKSYDVIKPFCEHFHTNRDEKHSSHGDNEGMCKLRRPLLLIFNISGYAIENQVKFATCTLLGAALTWWNGQIRALGPEAYA